MAKLAIGGLETFPDDGDGLDFCVEVDDVMEDVDPGAEDDSAGTVVDGMLVVAPLAVVGMPVGVAVVALATKELRIDERANCSCRMSLT